MRLFFSATSPYVRKVVATAHECGLFERLEIVPTQVFQTGNGYEAVNPLAKIPALELDGGEVLYDSPVICEYLDNLHDGIPLFPPSGGARWTALRRQALGDGVMDAALTMRVELLRPEHLQSADAQDAQTAKVTAALDLLEKEVDELGQDPTIGHLAIGCALGYLDLRFADLQWRAGRPGLAAWNETFAARHSMTASAHPAS
ncbi:putative glutathione S-transferase [Magnetospira sp. QH-2]|nr:putative glutathione S-transferase [Magnetospira sp. QH-2]